jgi:hypothetical protein
MELENQLKQEIKELNKVAIDWQNKLHDLAEGLPGNLEQLLETAQQTYDAFSCVLEKRQELKKLKLKNKE